MADSVKRIGILVFDDVEELEFVGPLEVFGTAARFGAPCSVSIISDHSPVVCRHRTRVCVDEQIDMASPKSVLIVPGGPGAQRAAMNPAFLRFLRLPHGVVAPVCTGSVVVAAAGVRAERSLSLEDCSGSNAPAVAGIDVALKFVHRLWGSRIADAVTSTIERHPVHRERSLYPSVRGLF